MVIKRNKYFLLITIILTIYTNNWGMLMGENENIGDVENNTMLSLERSNNEDLESAELDELIAMNKELKDKEKRHSVEATKKKTTKMSKQRRRTLQSIEEVISEWSSVGEKKKNSEKEEELENQINEHKKATLALSEIIRSLSENVVDKVIYNERDSIAEDIDNGEGQDSSARELEFIAKLTRGLPEETKQKILNNYSNKDLADQPDDTDNPDSIETTQSTTMTSNNVNIVQAKKPFSVKKTIYKVLGITGLIVGAFARDENMMSTSGFLLADTDD